jgi:mono/diheme cytochrome c family protein
MTGFTKRLLTAAGLVALVAAGVWLWTLPTPHAPGDAADAEQVARGRMLYAMQCASCHGAKLEGEPNWQQRKANGRLPAPPHDAAGHTWHHGDAQLFGIVKNGIGPYAPAGYQSDMPAFAALLSDDEIWAVLAYIKSTWPERIREQQRAMSSAQP